MESGQELDHNSVALSADVLASVDQQPKSAAARLESYELLNDEYWELMVKSSKQSAQNLYCFLYYVSSRPQREIWIQLEEV